MEKRLVRILIAIIFGLNPTSLLGQNLNYKEYCENHFEIFSKLDSNYSLYFLAELKIKSVKEIKFLYDTTGNIKDSSIANYYFFDSIGRTVEHRFDYRSKSTKYRSVTYTYSEDGTVRETYNDPFGPDYVLDGYYVPGKLPMYCEYRNRSYQIDSINVKKSHDGGIYTMRYYYNQDLFVKHNIYKEYLLSRLDYLFNNKLEHRSEIIYEY